MSTITDAKHQTVTVDGVNLFYREAGRQGAPGLILLHGQPCSSFYFRHVIGPLAAVAHVLAPDLPGFGFSEAPDDYEYSFEAMARTIDALTREVGIDRYFLYVHDFGSAVAYAMAVADPQRVIGLIIQNGNAHDAGLGPSWDLTKAYWKDPTPENRKAMPEWLNAEGVKNTYVGDIPSRVVPLVAPDGWVLDWQRMSQPGRVEIQFRIFEAYSKHVARFPEFSRYHQQYQPPALMLWGRHDPYFAIEEVEAYAKDLKHLEQHVYDGPHLLLETHYRECADRMRAFISELTRN